MTRRFPGSIIKAVPVSPTNTSASGIWLLPEVLQAIDNGNWYSVPKFVTSTTQTASADITAPATVLKGDVLVLCDMAYNASTTTPTDVTPTGFTGVNTVTGSINAGAWRMRVRFSYKIADGTESGATITGISGDQMRKICAQIRSDMPIVGVSASALINTTIDDADPAQQTLTASGGTPPVVGFTAFSVAGTSIDPRTTSITPTNSTNAGGDLYMHTYIQATAPANYTWDMEDEGIGNVLFGFYLHAFTY